MTVAWHDGAGKITHHQLNCSKLRQRKPGEGPFECSCGAEAAGPQPDYQYPGYSMLGEHHGQDGPQPTDGPDYHAERAAYDASRKPVTGPLLASGSWDATPPEILTTSSTGGQKGVKEARFDLIPAEALHLVAEHYGKGAKKYTEHNWRKGFEWSKSYAALQRHLNAFWAGEDLDPETGSPHLAAVVFHALTLLTFMVEQPGFDDRYKKGTK